MDQPSRRKTKAPTLSILRKLCSGVAIQARVALRVVRMDNTIEQ